MTPDRSAVALIESSWHEIALTVRRDGPRDPAAVHAALVELSPRWRNQAVSLVVELCGFAYGKVIDRAREVAAARRQHAPIRDEVIDELQTADDVLQVVNRLFERCDHEDSHVHPSFN
jgi:phosphoribosylformylglycinamidine (FGAM) synthase-like amidotransferase family enzyme